MGREIGGILKCYYIDMDIKQLLILCFAVSITLIACHFVYYLTRDKDDGFLLWIISLILLSLGFTSMLLRGAIGTTLSIVLTNSFFVSFAIARYDAISRFVTGKRIPYIYYSPGLLIIPFIIFFSIHIDNISIRNAITSVVIISFLFLSVCLLHKNATKNSFYVYYFSALIFCLFACSLAVRAYVGFLESSSDVFTFSSFSYYHFAFRLIVEIAMNIGFFMLFSNRAEIILKQTNLELKDTISNLNIALEEIKTLKGIIPICSYCKKIRDEEGYWKQVENYISDNTEAQFSHGICSECEKKAYKDMGLELGS